MPNYSSHSILSKKHVDVLRLLLAESSSNGLLKRHSEGIEVAKTRYFHSHLASIGYVYPSTIVAGHSFSELQQFSTSCCSSGEAVLLGILPWNPASAQVRNLLVEVLSN